MESSTACWSVLVQNESVTMTHVRDVHDVKEANSATWDKAFAHITMKKSSKLTITKKCNIIFFEVDFFKHLIKMIDEVFIFPSEKV